MTLFHRLSHWLENHWANPAYGGWVLGSLSTFFFIAATNTLSGWLYVMSGLGLALVLLSGYLAHQGVQRLLLRRLPIEPVSAGDWLTITLHLENPQAETRSLFELEDQVPPALGSQLPPQGGKPQRQALQRLPPHEIQTWTYTYPTQRRGVYRWDRITVRSAAPLGLCWARRDYSAPARAVVYPTVLPLAQCPLLDQLGREQDPQFSSQQRPQSATEGVTRTLRPYRWGDSMRLIHWRTSARHGDLRVRELEGFQGGIGVVLALDTESPWAVAQPGDQPTPGSKPGEAGTIAENFEQAVIAVASLYFYARQHQLPVQFWSADTGLLEGDRSILEVLAAIQPQTTPSPQPPAPATPGVAHRHPPEPRHLTGGKPLAPLAGDRAIGLHPRPPPLGVPQVSRSRHGIQPSPRAE
ncbi:DUF58 domain-containing protein [Prochlorothrix hollandica]|uniref:DUF58 domain-containing protein n=1 Tax=Prochlorothrix hollandica TaxID=1223 RepID=UPI000346A9E6|nr:DUF58 domain-containing protein [Prochlorothrix hollandica]